MQRATRGVDATRQRSRLPTECDLSANGQATAHRTNRDLWQRCGNGVKHQSQETFFATDAAFFRLHPQDGSYTRDSSVGFRDQIRPRRQPRAARLSLGAEAPQSRSTRQRRFLGRVRDIESLLRRGTRIAPCGPSAPTATPRRWNASPRRPPPTRPTTGRRPCPRPRSRPARQGSRTPTSPQHSRRWSRWAPPPLISRRPRPCEWKRRPQVPDS
jgi:hypothetical protein